MQEYGAVMLEDGHVHVTLLVFLPDKRHGDLDNYVKAFNDAVQGVIFADDKQVWSVNARMTVVGERCGMFAKVSKIPDFAIVLPADLVVGGRCDE
jgi:Holliday junction resolvase RusA-like endonuclease